MRTFLFISERGKSLPIAQRVYDEGNRVLFCTPDARYRTIGDGLIEKVSIDALSTVKPTIVIFDEPALNSDDAKELRKHGVLVYGSNMFADQIALNKTYAQKVLKTNKINVPKSYVFAPDSTDFVEVTVETILVNGTPLNVSYSFEELNLMDTGVGPQCEMGSVSCEGKLTDRLFEESFGKLLKVFKKAEFSGQLTLRTIVTKSTLYAYTLKPFINFNTFFGFIEGYRGMIGDLLISLAAGNTKQVKMRTNWTISVKIANPPFPYDYSAVYQEGVKINGLNDQNLRHVWLSDIYMNGARSCAGTSGELGYASARGENVREARRRAYRTIGNISLADLIYRSDIGDRVQEDHYLLRRWGWIR